jgi:hypothetical protein
LGKYLSLHGKYIDASNVNLALERSIDENSDVSSQAKGGFRDHYNKWHVVKRDDMM